MFYKKLTLGFACMFLQLTALDFHVKRATEEDMQWVNQSYEAIQFQKSELDNEIIAIAMVDNERVGVGRLVRIQENVYELGGMYVVDQCRGHGIASQIIDFLLDQVATEHSTIYCLPFSHLSSFYKKFGFKECKTKETIPQKIVLKHRWCNQTYEHKVDCLVRRST